jgi:lipopolysaccharide/colanic/teichoic acid biosynthesis glycosyltransferase
MSSVVPSFTAPEVGRPLEEPRATRRPEALPFGAEGAALLEAIREGRPFYLARTERVSLWQRAFEALVASAVLVLAAPVILVEALVIRLFTPGPALFRQQRVGVHGKPFSFVKFRTLYADARKRFPEMYAYQYDAEEIRKLRFKPVDDPRVTPQGRWLRKSTLDELPNFWNVLKGEMALVGPRPEIPEMLPYYEGDMLLKFTVRPGITGLAQVSGRGRLGFLETVAYDVEYVRRKSWRLDLEILLRTIKAVVLQSGAF